MVSYAVFKKAGNSGNWSTDHVQWIISEIVLQITIPRKRTEETINETSWVDWMLRRPYGTVQDKSRWGSGEPFRFSHIHLGKNRRANFVCNLIGYKSLQHYTTKSYLTLYLDLERVQKDRPTSNRRPHPRRTNQLVTTRNFPDHSSSFLGTTLLAAATTITMAKKPEPPSSFEAGDKRLWERYIKLGTTGKLSLPPYDRVSWAGNDVPLSISLPNRLIRRKWAGQRWQNNFAPGGGFLPHARLRGEDGESFALFLWWLILTIAKYRHLGSQIISLFI